MVDYKGFVDDCPHCGAKASVGFCPDESCSMYTIVVYCTECKCCAVGDSCKDPDSFTAQQINDTVARWNKRVEPNTKVTLEGKCGTCKYGTPCKTAFGNSKVYVDCKNPVLEEKRKKHKGVRLEALKQRTQKACKQYERKEEL